MDKPFVKSYIFSLCCLKVVLLMHAHIVIDLCILHGCAGPGYTHIHTIHAYTCMYTHIYIHIGMCVCVCVCVCVRVRVRVGVCVSIFIECSFTIHLHMYQHCKRVIITDPDWPIGKFAGFDPLNDQILVNAVVKC